MPLFKDRQDAGRQLAEKLSSYNKAKDTIVIAIPRGGVVVGATISSFLSLPLDVCFTKKIGHPLFLLNNTRNDLNQAIDIERQSKGLDEHFRYTPISHMHSPL